MIIINTYNSTTYYHIIISYRHCVAVIIVSLGKVVCADFVRRSTNIKLLQYKLAAATLPHGNSGFSVFVCQCYTRSAKSAGQFHDKSFSTTIMTAIIL